MTRTAFIAAIVSLTATSALAQEAFTGRCTDYKEQGKEACAATQWCQWAQPKSITLPNGQAFQPPGYCAFKRGHKQAWQATAQ